MPSTNNYIEEFLISIGIETGKVKKQAKEIDKVLNGLEKRKTKATTNEMKQKQKLYKLQRQSEADNMKHFIKQEEAKQRAIKKTKDMALGIRSGAAYRRLKATGKSGDFDSRINAAVAGRDAAGLRQLRREIQSTTTATRGLQRQMMGLATVQGGLTDSTRNMIRSYASVFAVFQGTMAIKRTGQDFESLRASMLVVSKDSDDATEKMKFIREEAFRLGIDLKTAAKAFLGLKASSGDALGEEGVKRLFTSVLSISKAFGMSVDDTRGTFKAFTQINCLAA